jgi:hypothetical protein
VPALVLRVVNPADARAALSYTLQLAGVEAQVSGSMACDASFAAETKILPRVKVEKPITAHLMVTGADGAVVLAQDVPLAERPRIKFALRNLLPVGYIEIAAQGPFGEPGATQYKVLDGNGKSVLDGSAPFHNGAASERVNTEALAPGKYRVVLTGTLTEAGYSREQTFNIEKTAQPDWIGAAAGKTDKALPPFTPIEQHGSRLICWNREYVFEKRFLPSQVTSGGEPLLADSVKLLATVGAETEDLAQLTSKASHRAENRIDMEASGKRAGIKLKAVSWMEEDGFWWVTVQLLPGSDKTLDKLILEIPVRREIAKYISPCSNDWTLATATLTDAGWKGGFVPILSLVNDDKGIAWYCESPAGWRPAGETGMSVDVTPEAATLRCELIGKPTSLKDGLTCSFGLQACPVKPIPADWRSRRMCHGIRYGLEPQLDKYAAAGVKTLIYHDTWTGDYGKPYTEYGDELRNLVKQCHAHGIKLLLYLGYGLGDKAPETELYGDYWDTMPVVRWDPGDKNPRRAFSMTCCRTPYWTDFMLNRIAGTLSEYDFDGFYYDGTDLATACSNTAHGCGYLDEQGKLHPSWPLLATRAFAKRMYAVCKLHRADTLIDCHTSNCVYPMRAAWVDQLWNGEQYESQSPGFHVPLDYFRGQCVGKQYGAPSEFLVYEKRPFELQEALSFTLLHDVRVRPTVSWKLDEMSRVWKIEDAFGVAEAEWMPYWKNADVVKVTADPAGKSADEGGLASLYVIRGKRTLVILSNVQTAPATVTARLALKELGLPDTAHARDAVSDAPIPITSGTIAVPLKGYDYRLVWVE